MPLCKTYKDIFGFILYYICPAAPHVLMKVLEKSLVCLLFNASFVLEKRGEGNQAEEKETENKGSRLGTAVSNASLPANSA